MSPVVRPVSPGTPSITPHQIVLAVSAIVTQAVAYGILNTGVAQTLISIGGIVIPSAFAVASALHLGRVHAAQVKAATTSLRAPVA